MKCVIFTTKHTKCETVRSNYFTFTTNMHDHLMKMQTIGMNSNYSNAYYSVTVKLEMSKRNIQKAITIVIQMTGLLFTKPIYLPG